MSEVNIGNIEVDPKFSYLLEEDSNIPDSRYVFATSYETSLERYDNWAGVKAPTTIILGEYMSHESSATTPMHPNVNKLISELGSQGSIISTKEIHNQTPFRDLLWLPPDDRNVSLRDIQLREVANIQNNGQSIVFLSQRNLFADNGYSELLLGHKGTFGTFIESELEKHEQERQKTASFSALDILDLDRYGQ